MNIRFECGNKTIEIVNVLQFYTDKQTGDLHIGLSGTIAKCANRLDFLTE